MSVNSKDSRLSDVPRRERHKKEMMMMDPIHGFIDISEYPAIYEITRTPHFQRLHRLYQLGMTFAAYPGATHSRFSHSIGAMHVFLILFDSVMRRSDIPDDEVARLRPVGAVCALLHDIGHGPFSHASERILEGGNFDHEAMTMKIIRSNPIRDILGENGIDADLVCDVLCHRASGRLGILSRLISSQLDADRIDYLMRDSYFTGVNYGKIDIQRIANTLNVREKNGEFEVTVYEKGLGAIEDYILGRHLMYKGVYFHRAARCMEHLLVGVFGRAYETDAIEIGGNFSKDRSVSADEMLKLDDGACTSLFHSWAESDDPVLSDLAGRVLGGRLLAARQIQYDRYAGGIREAFQDMLARHADDSTYPSRYYIIEDDGSSAYTTYSSSGSGASSGPIMMEDGEGGLHEASGVSPIIRNLEGTGSGSSVMLFYPIEFAGEIRDV